MSLNFITGIDNDPIQRNLGKILIDFIVHQTASYRTTGNEYVRIRF